MTFNRFTPHPDDAAALEALVDQFATRRQEQMSTRQLASLVGVAHASVYYLERRRPVNPLVATLQRYGEPLGLTLRITLDGLPEAGADPTAVALEAGGYLGTARVKQLRCIREQAGVTRTAVQNESGWSWAALAAFENSDREPLLSMVQRYARLLGGRAVLAWEEL